VFRLIGGRGTGNKRNYSRGDVKVGTVDANNAAWREGMLAVFDCLPIGCWNAFYSTLGRDIKRDGMNWKTVDVNQPRRNKVPRLAVGMFFCVEIVECI
jgi:hypothetical protein